MKIQSSLLLLAFAASNVNADHASLRHALADPALEFELEQYSCTMAGAGGQEQCDAAKDESGETCVWCSVGSFGACLSADQASIIEDKIPGLTCDDSPSNDDGTDDAAADDDASPPNNDDDTYWKCLKDGSDSEEDCDSSGCKWCTTKAGFGICLDEAAAESASKSDWFECKLMLQELELMDLQSIIAPEKKEKDVQTPGDPACIMATLQQDESVCTSTADSAGNPCSWCTIDNFNVCLDEDLATMAEQYGGSCGDDVPIVEAQKVEDPADTTCIVATLQQDESACTSTSDADGRACEWCEIAQAQVCLNADQAQFAEQFGGSCGDSSKIATA